MASGQLLLLALSPRRQKSENVTGSDLIGHLESGMATSLRPSLVHNFCQTYFSLSTAGDETTVTHYPSIYKCMCSGISRLMQWFSFLKMSLKSTVPNSSPSIAIRMSFARLLSVILLRSRVLTSVSQFSFLRGGYWSFTYSPPPPTIYETLVRHGQYTTRGCYQCSLQAAWCWGWAQGTQVCGSLILHAA